MALREGHRFSTHILLSLSALVCATYGFTPSDESRLPPARRHGSPAAPGNLLRHEPATPIVEAELIAERSVDSSADDYSTAIVMTDTRESFKLDPTKVKVHDLSWLELTSLLNYRYAEKHNYTFVFYMMPRPSQRHGDNQTMCQHSRHGLRHPAWCKLLSLMQVQKDHPNIQYRAYLDSDMYVTHQEIGIDKFLQSVVPAVPGHTPTLCKVCQGPDCTRKVLEADAWLPSTSLKGSVGLLGAFVLLRAGARGDAVLKKVWNWGDGLPANETYAVKFPWEQQAWSDLFWKQFGHSSQVVGISGLQGDWVGHGPPERCNQFDGGIKPDWWANHTCHFEDDDLLVLMQGDWGARDRLRNTFGCKEANRRCFKEDAAFLDELEQHNMYYGNRKIALEQEFLMIAGNETAEVQRLYALVKKSAVQLTHEQLIDLGANLETPADNGAMSFTEDRRVKASSVASISADDWIDWRRRSYLKQPAPEPGTIPVANRSCWCDNA